MTRDHFYSLNVSASWQEYESKHKVRNKPLNALIYPHAIVDSSGKVLLIRAYPSRSRSSSIIPIPDSLNVKPGWFWNGKTFTKEKP